MAIPEGRMSTEVVEGTFGIPENRVFYALTSYEMGPIAIEDTTEGLLYQVWVLTYDPATGVITATPETTGPAVEIATISGLISLSFTFDQNGRITYVYTTAVSAYMYWYDTALGHTTTTDLGSDCITPAILLDDKRNTQSNANDMLLWYTKDDGGGTYDLYMLRQRDRFLTEYLMESGLPYPYIHNIGMNNGLRLQLALKSTVPNVPYT